MRNERRCRRIINQQQRRKDPHHDRCDALQNLKRCKCSVHRVALTYENPAPPLQSSYPVHELNNKRKKAWERERETHAADKEADAKL